MSRGAGSQMIRYICILPGLFIYFYSNSPWFIYFEQLLLNHPSHVYRTIPTWEHRSEQPPGQVGTLEEGNMWHQKSKPWGNMQTLPSIQQWLLRKFQASNIVILFGRHVECRKNAGCWIGQGVNQFPQQEMFGALIPKSENKCRSSSALLSFLFFSKSWCCCISAPQKWQSNRI